MNGMRWCTIALLAAALTGCPSNNGNNTDDGGMADGGMADGGSGGDGGTDGGASPATIPFAEVCSNVTEGFKESEFISNFGFCGVPVTRADLEHMYYFADFGITWNDAFAGSNCAVTDGGLSNQIARYSEAISAGRLEYNAQKAFECRQNGRNWKDGGYVEDTLFGACDEVFVAKVAAGGTCKAGYECSGDTYCKPSNESTCEGTCVALVAADQPCSPIRDECVADHACSDDGTGYKCFALASEGEACEENAGCRDGMTCFDDGTNRFCQKLSALGGACELDVNGEGNCAEGNCITAGGSTVGTCTAPAALGQPCGTTPEEGLPLCDPCLECVVDSSGQGNTCQITGRTGANCVEDADCFDPQVWACVDSKCEVRPRPGEICTARGNGAQSNCMYYDNFCKLASDGAETGTCTALPKLGEACGDGFDKAANCSEGYCSETTSVCSAFSVLGQDCTTSQDSNGKSPFCAGDNLFCDTRAPDGDGIDGICRTVATLGESCDPAVPCDSNSFCDDQAGVCVARLDIGADCFDSVQCQSNFCDEGGSCAELKALGELCAVDDDCQSGTCDPSSNKCVTPCGVEPNEADGCMNYDLGSFSTYLFFAAVLVPFMRRRAKKQL